MRKCAFLIVYSIANAGLILLGSLFLLWGLGMLVVTQMNQFAMPMTEMGVLVADTVLSSLWIAGGILLIMRKPLGIASGLGLLFSESALFIALVIYLLQGPVLTGILLNPGDILVVIVMGMVCFIPFYFYLRALRSKEYLHDTI
jgi:hypothetical protein